MYSVVSHYPIEFRIIGDKRDVGVQDFKIESATSDIINLLFQALPLFTLHLDNNFE